MIFLEESVKLLNLVKGCVGFVMTAVEKNRVMAVENMYRLYKKYYPIWVENTKQDCQNSESMAGVEENSTSVFILPLPFFFILSYNIANT